MKLCFSTFAYTEYPLEDAVKRIAQIGYEGIEIVAIRPHAFPDDLEKKSRKKLKRLIDSLNLELSAICQGPILNMVSPIEKERQETIRHIKNCVKLASELGAKIVVTVPGMKIFLRFGVTYEKAWGWAKEGVTGCVNLAEDEGVTLALEPLSRLWGVNFMYTMDEALRLAREIDSKSVRVMVDVEHRMHEEGSLPECVKKAGDLLAYVHLRDTLGTRELVTPGNGTINFQTLFRALTEINYRGYLTVEFWDLTDPDKYATESKRFLKNVLRTL